MTFLGDLITDTTASSIPLSELLRRVKVLASRTNSLELAEWTNRELEGYSDYHGLPDYRGPLETRVLGDFSGPYGSRQLGVEIPMTSLPEDMRVPGLFKTFVFQSVSEIEAVIASQSDKGTVLRQPWQPEITNRVNWLLQQGKMELIPLHGVETIYRTVSIWTFQGILETVRGRLLDLALGLEKVAPNLMSDGSGAPSEAVSPTQVQHIYHTTVKAGGSAAIGINPVAIQPVAQEVAGLIVAALDAAAASEQDEETRNWLKKSSAYLGNAGRDILVEIAATALNRQMGGM